jgi:hypothetical protein
LKDSFYEKLLDQMAVSPADETLLVCGDFNGHIGASSPGFDGVHGGFGYGNQNADGVRILDFCAAANLSITNSFFSKTPNKLITYRSGDNRSQIDFILVRRSMLKHVRNVTVINNEECTPQHKLLLADIKLNAGFVRLKSFPSRRRVWKLKDPEVCAEYKHLVQEKLDNLTLQNDIEDTWKELKACILDSFDTCCGWSNPKQNRRETWWWNNEVELAIKEKRKLWNVWKRGGSKEPYLAAKRRAKHAVYTAKTAASEASFSNLHEKDKLNHVFRLARKMRSENQDIIGEKCIRNEQGIIAYEEKEKLDIWKNHYENLLNAEFPWDEPSLSSADPVLGPSIQISDEMVQASINHLKSGKAAGPSGIVVEMLKAAGNGIVPHISTLINQIIQCNKVPDEWNRSYIINLYKGKGDALDCGNYRGLKLLEIVQYINAVLASEEV